MDTFAISDTFLTFLEERVIQLSLIEITEKTSLDILLESLYKKRKE